MINAHSVKIVCDRFKNETMQDYLNGLLFFILLKQKLNKHNHIFTIK